MGSHTANFLLLRELPRGQFLDGALYPLHHRVETPSHPSVFHIEQHLKTMLRGESLHHLDAPPVPMHIAEAARIHENVEAELLSGAESTQHLVMLSAMPQPQSMISRRCRSPATCTACRI